MCHFRSLVDYHFLWEELRATGLFSRPDVRIVNALLGIERGYEAYENRVEGTPPQAVLDERILKAPLKQLAKSRFHALSLDDIAAHGATSKQALPALAVEVGTSPPPPSGGPWRGPTPRFLLRLRGKRPDASARQRNRCLAVDALGGALRAPFGERSNRQLTACLRKSDQARREVLRELLSSAEQRREIRRLSDVEQAIDTLLVGAWLRYMIDCKVLLTRQGAAPLGLPSCYGRRGGVRYENEILVATAITV